MQYILIILLLSRIFPHNAQDVLNPYSPYSAGTLNSQFTTPSVPSLHLSRT